MELNDKIIIYTASNGQTELDVHLENETVWLNAYQMADLFGRDSKTIRKHIRNAINEELSDTVVVAKFASTTKHGAIKGKTQVHNVEYYNLDVIISVGYRVKSKSGVEFRRWANRILKDYLVKGYAINNSIASKKYKELFHLVQILGRTVNSQSELTTDESHELISVVSDYTYALDTLDRYDYQQLTVEQTTKEELFHATYDNAMAAIKRIAATLFLWFMQNNGILYETNRRKRISDGTLVALTLMIAESRTEEKDTMVKVVVNLINKNCNE